MKVKFVPQNLEFEIKPGDSVMNVAHENNIYVKSVCKGVPSCAECRVRVVEGEHNVLPPGSDELALIGTGHFIDRRRLSCQLHCFGDITVDMTEQEQKRQGLIGGRKSKAKALKDDRVEEAVAIRADSSMIETPEGGESPTPSPNQRVSGRPNQPRNNDRNAGPRGGSDQKPRERGQRGDLKPRDNQAPRQIVPQTERPTPTQGHQKSSPVSADRPQQRPQGPSRAVGNVAPQGAAGESGNEIRNTEGGGKRRRRRRGGRGKGAAGGEGNQESIRENQRQKNDDRNDDD